MDTFPWRLTALEIAARMVDLALEDGRTLAGGVALLRYRVSG